MPDIWVMAGHVLIPLVFGLIPACLPSRVPLRARWASWLALFAGGAVYVAWLQGAVDPFHWLGIASLALSSLLSLCMLVMEGRQAGKALT
jgi:Na+-transporting NADH:ubiquinone oxidoreductase subunit NqrB